MKKNLLLVLFTVASLHGWSQNGLIRHPSPVAQNGRWQYSAANAVVIDSSGNSNKWVCYIRGGLGKFNGTSWTVYDPSNSGMPSYQAYSIAFLKANNKAWIGTDSGAVSFDGTTWQRFNSANSGIGSNKVYSMTLNGGKIWFGTDRGISMLNGNTWSIFNKQNSGLISDTVHAIAFESNGLMWAGTDKGLMRCQGTWSAYTKSNSGLADTKINCLYMDPSNVLWIGTNGSAYFENGGTILPVRNLQKDLLYPSQNGGIFAFCQSAGGGAAYGEVNSGNAYGLIDIGWPKNNIYIITPPKHMSFEKSTGTYWYMPYNLDLNLLSFKPTQYNPAFLGFNFDNFKDLDVNEVRAAVSSQGDMHFDRISAQYEVPKGSGKNADFAASLWVGGIDPVGTMHVAAMTYRQKGIDYWPGPLDTLAGLTDSVTSAKYDQVWKVDRYQIELFKHNFQTGQVQNGSFTPPASILSWPAAGTGTYSRNLAPYVDVNHNGQYDPLTGGDYPLIHGDQELFRIFNDNLAKHGETGGTPLKVEVHASAYAYSCPSLNDSDKVLNYTTFYHYDIFNRSNTNYTQMQVGSWQDVDLGNYSDDYIGCNPLGNYGFVYNGAPCDGTGGPGEYGCKPPMMSTVILNGPLAVPGDGIDNNNNGVIDEPGETNLMTCFHPYNNDYNSQGNPGGLLGITPVYPRPMDYYNYLQGKWCDSTFMTKGSHGYGGTQPYRFMYPDMPSDTSGWSEPTVHNSPGDRRFLIGCGPFNLNAGGHVSFDYALVFTRDTSLAPRSTAFFQKNASDNRKVQSWFAQGNAPSCFNLNLGVQEMQTPAGFAVYPNPFSDQVTLSFAKAPSDYSIDLIDLMGKEINLKAHLSGTMQVLDLSSLAPGMYFIRVKDEKGQAVKKIIKR